MPSGTNVVTLTGLDDFNLARWKPVSGDKFLEEMIAVSLNSTSDKVFVPTSNRELDDGRVQIVISAEVYEMPGRTVSVQPYLTIFYDDESSSRPNAFVRTDVVLSQEIDEPRSQRPAGRALAR